MRAETVRQGPSFEDGLSATFRSPLRPLWSGAVLVFVGYYLAAQLGFALTFHPQAVSTLWPPNAILLAALLCSTPRHWWLFLLAAFPAHLLAQLPGNVPALQVFAWFLSNCGEALIGAGLIQWRLRGPLRFTNLRELHVFVVCGALLAPFLSSFIDIALIKMIGWGQGAFSQLWQTRFYSNVLATLIFVPFILIWKECAAILHTRPLAQHLEGAALVLGVLVVSGIVFSEALGENSASVAMLAILPFLLWAAVRLGLQGTSMALLLITLCAIWGAIHGHRLFQAESVAENMRLLQVFLIVVSFPFLLLAAILEERNRTEQEAHEQRRHMTHLTRVAVLGQLSGALAHELNQPLTAILCNAQAAQKFLQREHVDQNELREILKDIVDDDKRAGEVIRRLRTLLSQGETHPEQVDINAMLHETLSLVRGDLVARQITLKTSLSSALPLVKADRVQLQQVLLNLIVNAAEAMSANIGERRLVISTFVEGNDFCMSVADNGSGLSAQLLDKIFLPFFTTKEQGMGLGLSISRSILEAHSGKLWAQNNQSGGATLNIALPLGEKKS
ncbi:MAG TPA: MASE1 domain-containing protein [Burkholderiales bacterium]|nr:MASE1 domain-containing protein [Burkholderiales bacterium]